jgi:hypothetical protein
VHEPSSTVRTRLTIDPTSSNVYGEILKRVFIDALREEQKRSNGDPIPDWLIMNLIMVNNRELPLSASAFYAVMNSLEECGVLEYDEAEFMIIPKKLCGVTQ